MSDYIPKGDAEKLAWLKHFSVWLNAHGTSYGLTPQQVSAYIALVANADTKFNAHLDAKDAAHAAASAKNQGLGDAETDARELAQFLQHNPNMTDEARLGAGLTAPDSQPTPTPEGAIYEIAPPLILLDFSIRRQVTIHWGADPANERLNKRPAGTIGCEIQYALGGLPAEESAWAVLELDSESPAVHHLNNSAPTTVAYRARYVGKTLKYGGFSDPAVCTVSA